MEDLKEEILLSLQEKGIVNEEKKITEFGIIPLIMWEIEIINFSIQQRFLYFGEVINEIL